MHPWAEIPFLWAHACPGQRDTSTAKTASRRAVPKDIVDQCPQRAKAARFIESRPAARYIMLKCHGELPLSLENRVANTGWGSSRPALPTVPSAGSSRGCSPPRVLVMSIYSAFMVG